MIASYLAAAKRLIDDIEPVTVEAVAGAIRAAACCEGTVFTMGNGGSAATASHFVNDLVSLGIKAVCLNDNTPTIMAIANDYEYAEVFVQQLQTCHGYSGDLVIAFSCSGESENVVRAVEWAGQHNRGATIAFCGSPASRLAQIATIALCVPGGVQHQEDAHLMLCHAIYCELKEAR